MKKPQKHYPYSDHLPQRYDNLLIYNRLWKMRRFENAQGFNNGFRKIEDDDQYSARLEEQRKFLAQTILEHLLDNPDEPMLIAMQECPIDTAEAVGDLKLLAETIKASGSTIPFGNYSILTHSKNGLSFFYICPNDPSISTSNPEQHFPTLPLTLDYNPKKYCVMQIGKQLYVNVHGDYKNSIWNLINPITQYCIDNMLSPPIFLGDFNQEMAAQDKQEALPGVHFSRLSAGLGSVASPGRINADQQWMPNRNMDGFIFVSFNHYSETGLLPDATFCYPPQRADSFLVAHPPFASDSLLSQSLECSTTSDIPHAGYTKASIYNPAQEKAYSEARQRLTELSQDYLTHLAASPGNTTRRDKHDLVKRLLDNTLGNRLLNPKVAVDRFRSQLQMISNRQTINQHSLTPRLSSAFLTACAGILLTLGIIPFVIAIGLSKAISGKFQFWKPHGTLYLEACEKTAASLPSPRQRG